MTTNAPRKRGPNRLKPHPREAEIRELLAKGLNNTSVTELLNVPPRQVARVRGLMDLGPAPRSTWRNRPHPKAVEIRELLEDGHSNAEIRRRTGADWRTIARMRVTSRVGEPTIRTGPPHPKTEQVRELLATHSNRQIAAELQMDRATVQALREDAGVAYVPAPRGYATAEDKWAAHVSPVDGGHLEWTGERAGPARTPVMRFREKSVSPAAIAFRKHTGRDPVGLVKAECEHPHCVAPEHVQDEPGRQAVRLQLRRIKGLPDPDPVCASGHDQAVHGRLERDAVHYCEACQRDNKQAAGRAA
ncbi:hypothetical protein F3K40_15410 [Streptomyces sp. LBUM 1478]|uniref:hypothetical protein n=1 Tax=Streptomyces scabiei TaxID=1930 RepID=UPI000AA76AD1|nr:hypothetical protein [Streptomyces scabiei]MBP5906845.1 hypothetical protein [Streptomyces sp. LBUM 1478]MBP5930428.1 hypothetical protein [Streptomyces sp. LBUM 1479]